MSISSREITELRTIMRNSRWHIERMKNTLDGIAAIFDTLDTVAVRLMQAFQAMEAATISDETTQTAFEDVEKQQLRRIIKDLQDKLRRLE